MFLRYQITVQIAIKEHETPKKELHKWKKYKKMQKKVHFV